MTPVYIIKLIFIIQKTNIRAQKIAIMLLEIYAMILAEFLFQNNLRRVLFFEETFLLTNISIKIVLKMLIWQIIISTFSLVLRNLFERPILL